MGCWNVLGKEVSLETFLDFPGSHTVTRENEDWNPYLSGPKHNSHKQTKMGKLMHNSTSLPVALIAVIVGPATWRGWGFLMMITTPIDTMPQPHAIPLMILGIKIGIKCPSHWDDETVCIAQTQQSSPGECSQAWSGVGSPVLLKDVYCTHLFRTQLSQLSITLATMSTQRTPIIGSFAAFTCICCS